MNPTPKIGVRDRMISEIQAEVARQTPPDGTDAATIDHLTKSVVDALLGLKNGRFVNDKKAAESIVTKLQQIVP